MGETEAPLCEKAAHRALSCQTHEAIRLGRSPLLSGGRPRRAGSRRPLASSAPTTPPSRAASRPWKPRSRPSCSSGSPQGYALTEQGERLLANAEAMETQALAVASELGGADLAALRHRAHRRAGRDRHLLPRAWLGALAERHPGLTCSLVALPRTFSLSKREADIAVTLEQPTEGRLVSRKLTDYASGSMPRRIISSGHGPVAELSDLAGKTLVTYVADLLYSPVLDLFLGPREIHRPPLRMRQRGGPGRGRCGPASASASCTTTPCASSRNFRSCCRTYLVSAHLLARDPCGCALLAPGGGGLFLHLEPSRVTGLVV